MMGGARMLTGLVEIHPSAHEYRASSGDKTMTRSLLIIRLGSRERISGTLVKLPESVDVFRGFNERGRRGR